jgi:hypothetical protein
MESSIPATSSVQSRFVGIQKNPTQPLGHAIGQIHVRQIEGGPFEIFIVVIVFESVQHGLKPLYIVAIVRRRLLLLHGEEEKQKSKNKKN